jgi:hypothetical protein
MTFRDAYKEKVDLLSPSEAVVDSILLKMRKEAQNPTSPSLIRRIPASRLAAAAAGICILVAAAVVIPAVLRGAPAAENQAADLSPLTVTDSVRDGNYMFAAEAEEYADFDMADDALSAQMYNRADDAGIEAEAESFFHSPMAEAMPEPEGTNAEEADDMALAVSMEEWLLSFIHYFEYYDYQTYKDWDGGGIWDNLGGFPILEIPLIIPEWVRNLPDDVIWDSPYSERTFNTLGEAIAFFLSEEHRIVFIDYYYTLDEFDDSFGGHLDFYDRTLDEAEPIYSVLSRNMNSGLITDTSFYLGHIGISILGNNGFVSLGIRPCNGLTFSSSGTHLSYKLEEGTFEKLLSYLIYIE